jgi:hypothetical protein
MSNKFNSGIDENPVLDVQINLPYTLTTGKAAGSFLVALDQKVIWVPLARNARK